eukprot:CAMPEP_0177595730 /NCGR_PEP_ID=MMETSP0419_2-20121207/10543_1 /TAXON_ID=582737 /ORGANISM="Tetraselmis sp., Strain GSL018" /LENGTH=160 /DNA_ID=CAMNT_0019087271 /DNA_START=45 /DNA_END=527 /DNA_ORIENTATION=+
MPADTSNIESASTSGIDGNRELAESSPFSWVPKMWPFGRDSGPKETPEERDFSKLRKTLDSTRKLRPLPQSSQDFAGGSPYGGIDLLGGVHSEYMVSTLLSRRRFVYQASYGLTYDVWADSAPEYTRSQPMYGLSVMSIGEQVGRFASRVLRPLSRAPNG